MTGVDRSRTQEHTGICLPGLRRTDMRYTLVSEHVTAGVDGAPEHTGICLPGLRRTDMRYTLVSEHVTAGVDGAPEHTGICLPGLGWTGILWYQNIPWLMGWILRTQGHPGIWAERVKLVSQHTRVGVGWSALKQQGSSTITERSVQSIAVSSDPANVGHTPKLLARLVVKHMLQYKTRFLILPAPTHFSPWYSYTVYITYNIYNIYMYRN